MNLQTFTSDLWQTRSAVLEGPAGSVAFDPTFFPREVEAICSAAEAAAGSGSCSVVYTHGDWDHIVAARRLAGATALGHPALRCRSAAARRATVTEIDAFDARWYVQRPAAVFPELDDAPADGQRREVAGVDLHFFHTPGHTDDSLFVVVPELRAAVAGDLLSALEFPFVNHSVAAYRATLDKVAALVERFSLTRIVPGHGPDAAEPAEIRRRLDDDRTYLEDLAEAAEARADPEAAEAVAAAVGFRGKPVAAAQADAHLDNARRALREVGGAR